MEPAGQGWECVEDPQLARHPQPTRLPQPQAPATPDQPQRDPSLLPEEALPPDRPLPLEEPPEMPAPADAASPPGDVPEADPPLPDGIPPPGAQAAPIPTGTAADDLPEYARLAFQPPNHVPLTELPGDFSAVQVIAMPSKEALERFVTQTGLRNVSAARVERGGELFYVLLLGIYETQELAERAVATMPALDGAEPWIRPLDSLQSAMQRADRLAGSTRY